jgi:beta-fructofuranosidase
MKEFTREERYRVLQDASELSALYTKNTRSIYRQNCHVQPLTGLSNDPNGFIYAYGQWHLFYQWCPWGPVHGLKYWYHVTSDDLVHWQNAGIGLAPDNIYDNKGCYSGTSLNVNGDVYVYYTGNHRDDNWERTAYTCAAKMNKDGSLTKLEKPLFGPRADYTEHQRDPMAVYDEKTKQFYIMIGAASRDGRGCVLVYASKKPLEGWQFKGELHVKGYEQFGKMWECPCFTHIDGHDVLIFSPQFKRLDGRGQNTNHNIYLKGKMDFEALTFVPDGSFAYLDYGFDFYAAQVASNKPVMTAWMGLPDAHYPSNEDEWEGSLTLPRVLSFKEGHLYQKPAEAMKELRLRELHDDRQMVRSEEIVARFDGHDSCLNLFTKENGHDGFMIVYDESDQMVTIDKSSMNNRFNEDVFEMIDIPLDEPLETMQIFIDHSSVEIFINEGKYVFTSHVYPTEEEMTLTHTNNMDLKMYALGQSVDTTFKL